MFLVFYFLYDNNNNNIYRKEKKNIFGILYCFWEIGTSWEKDLESLIAKTLHNSCSTTSPAAAPKFDPSRIHL